MSFFSELQRRNVFKVSAAYAILAWLFIQIIETVLPVFGAPDWVLQTLIFFVILGFFGAVILAWVFEITPAGIKTQEAADVAGSQATGRKLNTLIILGLSLAVVFLLLKDSLFGVSPPETVESPVVAEADILQDEIIESANLEKSLAVLPFADLSPEGDQEYFSDGLSEELLNKLAQVDDLQVTARTSSFFYKGRNEDMRTIGEQLGVNYILEGSVRKANDQIRITAQLIQADNGFHLWSDTYDRELADIFELQDEIAIAVTTALSITLGAGEFDLPGMTRNIEAYEESLKATSEALKFTATGLRQAIEHIERAVSIDSEFYSGWGLLDQIYLLALQVFPQDQTAEFVNRRAYARQLLIENAPDHPVAKQFRILDLIETGEYVEAELLALQLIEQSGNTNSPFISVYANLLSQVGRNQDALSYWLMARRVNPKDVAVSLPMHRTYLSLDRVGEARLEIERGLTIASGEAEAALRRGYWHAALQIEDKELAIEALRNSSEQEISPDSWGGLWIRGEDEIILEEIRNLMENDNLSLIILGAMAQYSVIGGDVQMALDIRRRSGDLTTIWMPYASEMRELPDFKLFMEEQGIADYWRATGNWADKCRPLADSDTDFECF